MSTDLHAAILAAIEHLEQTARAGSPWKTYGEDTGTIQYGDFGWYVVGAPGGEFEDSEQGKADAALYRATGDPASVLRLCQGLHDWMAEHDDADCHYCAADPDDPCPDMRRWAYILGIQASEEGS